MKTALPAAITNRPEAMSFLQALIDNGEVFHPEDDAHDIDWQLPKDQQPTHAEAELLNKLMEDIYNIEGNNGDHRNPKFDPCQYVNIHDDGAMKQTKDIIRRMQEGMEPGKLMKFHVFNWIQDTIIEPGMGMQEIVNALQNYFPDEYAKAMDIVNSKM